MKKTFRTYDRIYDPRKFGEIRDPFFLEPDNKPQGGWWACPTETNEWFTEASKWSQAERDFYRIPLKEYTEFVVDTDKFLEINSWEDMRILLQAAQRVGWKKTLEIYKNFGVQAILVTRRCLDEWNKSAYDKNKNRWTDFENTWEIESLFVFDPECIQEVKYQVAS